MKIKIALKRTMKNEPTAQEINLAMSNPINPFYTPPK
jgi:formaldehyde-activating enzyme involved in methanogenesis